MKKILLMFVALMCANWVRAQSDDCAGATALSVNTPTTGTNVGSTGGDAGLATAASCWFDSANFGSSVWYTFTPSASGDYGISTACSADGNVDTQILILEGSCATPTLVAGGCNDDISGTDYRSAVSVSLVAGTTYYILIDGWGTGGNMWTGDFCIEVVGTECGNNVCEAGETYATCGGDCPCETTLDYLSWPDFAGSTTPLIYCPAELTDAGLGYEGGPNEDPAVGYIPFVINSSIESTLANPDDVFGSAVFSAGSFYNSTSPPAANATGDVDRFIGFIKLTQADLDAGSLTITFTGNNGDAGCDQVFNIDLSSLAAVDLAAQCPLFTCGANGCETNAGEDYCTCPGDCTCNISGSFYALDAQGTLVANDYPFGFCSDLVTAGSTPGNAYYLISVASAPTCVVDFTVSSAVGVVGDYDASGAFVPGFNQIGATSQNGFLILELTQSDIDAVLAGSTFDITFTADNGNCEGILTFSTANMPTGEIDFITDLNTSCGVTPPACASTWTSVTADAGTCAGDDLVFNISGLTLDAGQSITVAAIVNAAGTGFSDLATEGFTEFADAYNATALPYAIAFDDLGIAYTVDATAGTVTVPGGITGAQCSSFDLTLYVAIVDGLPLDYTASAECGDAEFVYTVYPAQPQVIETAGDCDTAATLVIGYDNGDGAGGDPDGDFDDAGDEICGTLSSALPVPVCATGNTTTSVAGYTAAELGTILGGGATCYTPITATLNASCPNLDPNGPLCSCPDPGTCDDGVCSNGIETWNETTCSCQAGTAPTPCVSDGNCANGIETWDAATCTCSTVPTVLGCTNATATNYNANATCDDGSCTFACPDPGTCNDGVCSNGVETWNGTTCSCQAGTAPTPCVSDGNCANGIETWDAATCTCSTVATVLGCTNPSASNYNANATCDNGSCTFACPDPGTCNDGVCSNGVETWNGTTCSCQAGTAPTPCVSDGNCANGIETWDAATCTCSTVATVVGCTNPLATNYNANATCDSGDCIIPACPEGDTDGDGICNSADNCPNLSGQIGNACNDNNSMTINDAISANCVCTGTLVDVQINITDPCSCSNPMNIMNGTDVALFAETVTIEGPAGTTFTVASQTGMLSANGALVPVGTTVTTNANGIAELNFYHSGGPAGFSVTFSSIYGNFPFSGGAGCILADCVVDPCESLAADEVGYVCESNTWTYTYQLSGGTAPYNVFGDFNGTDLVAGETITLSGADGGNFEFTVTDSDGCSITVVRNNVQCVKCTFTIEMNEDEDIACPGESVSGTYMFTDVNEDFPETGAYAFAIHTASGSQAGTVLAANTTGVFSFSDISGAQYGVTYYLSAIAGEDANGDGIPDYEDNPCVKVAPGVAVEFIAPIAINATYQTCDEASGNQAVSYVITGGTGSYSVTGSVNGTQVANVAFTASYSDGQTPSIQVTDGSGCPGASYVGTPIECSKTDISLISYTGIATERGNELTWVTGSEYQNDFFTIARSKDGVNFDVIGTVDGSGTTNSVRTYNYIDAPAACEQVYYRLSQTDFDGSVTVVDHLVSLRNTEFCQLVSISPIPANSAINVSYITATNGQATMSVYDVVGKELSRINVDVVEGSNMVTININELANGVYFLTVSQDGNTQNIKFVKK